MKNIIAIAIFGLIFTVGQSTFAQSSSRFTVTRSVIASGGTTFSTSSRFQLASTIAQPLAAVPSSSRFSIQGGFWIWPSPIIFAPTKVGTNFIVSIQTEPGKTYTVQYADSLSTLNWQNLPSITGDGTVKTVTNSAPNVTQRFYRLNRAVIAHNQIPAGSFGALAFTNPPDATTNNFWRIRSVP